MKNKLYCIIFLMFLTSNCFGYPSHHSDGYAIRINNFELFISYYPDYADRILTRTDGMFWKILTWVYNNKNIFSNINAVIDVYIRYSDNEISISRDDNWLETKYIYKQDTMADTICKAVSLILNISRVIENDKNIDIDVYMVGVYHDYDESKGWISYVENKSNIFHGSFGSYMYNTRTEEYYILFWTKELADVFIERNKIKRYNLRKLKLSKGNIYYELDR